MSHLSILLMKYDVDSINSSKIIAYLKHCWIVYRIYIFELLVD